ncbi:hypothetical protein EDB87DRAFT_1631893 [Lactarius vividus]|nr:hypothetical protein EDB87DRAFT_1631893 [Lactarius vividus]
MARFGEGYCRLLSSLNIVVALVLQPGGIPSVFRPILTLPYPSREQCIPFLVYAYTLVSAIEAYLYQTPSIDSSSTCRR